MGRLTRDRPVPPGGPSTLGGLGFALTAAVSFGLSGPVARGLMDVGWSAGAAVTARMLIGGAVLVPAALVVLRGRWGLLRGRVGLLAAYGLMAVALAQFAYFNAIRTLDVGVAMLLEYVAPVAVVAWMWLRHHERPSRLTLLGGAIAAVGLPLVLDLVGGSAAISGTGVVWALLAMVGAAYFFVVSARMDNGIPGLVLATAGLLVGGLALLLLGAVGLVPFAVSARPATLAGLTVPWWGCLALLGVVSAAVPYLTGIAAGRRLGSRLASFAGLMEVLAALLFAWLLLGQAPRPVQLAGGVLVLVGVAVVKLGESAVVATVEPLPDPGPVPLSERPAA